MRRGWVPSSRKKPGGNFSEDLEALLEVLAAAPIMELGKPLPREQHLPRGRAGRCPSAHNRILLGKELT
jgi:hypothetical protein